METPEEIDRPKTFGSPASVGFLEDNSTVISGDVESTPADQRVWSVLSLSGESLKTTGIINTAICWTDVLSAKASTIGTLQSSWIPAISSLDNLLWTSPDFIARVRVKLMWESLYHVHFALQTTNGRLLAQLGRSWQIEAKDSDNFASFSSAGSRRRKPHPAENESRIYVVVKYRELGSVAAWKTIHLYRGGLQTKHRDRGYQKTIFHEVLDNSQFQGYITPLKQSGYLDDQDVWTLAWGIVKCACVTAKPDRI
ncbi:hypothetical protein NliqN6_6284 [Naganishia liquefaciens]|uniref:Uncharacterized protein n=1 Tax=Naganishia liquefaciens TaxID=104408 RepID=A0A8H3TZD9_9TREE|nr:hypothetical protein NliqN6_6284 [Naganishia liquefaciens]